MAGRTRLTISWCINASREPQSAPRRISQLEAQSHRLFYWLLSKQTHIRFHLPMTNPSSEQFFCWPFLHFNGVSEYTVSRHNLPCGDVIILEAAVKLHFKSFKFSQNRADEILLPWVSSPLCPVIALAHYSDQRPNATRFFFVDQEGTPLRVSKVQHILCQIAALINLPSCLITPHSFHIGVDKTADLVGLSDKCIMRMGRWSSAALRKYIHCQVNSF